MCQQARVGILVCDMRHISDYIGISDYGDQLFCPFCKDKYVHFGHAKYKGSDDYRAWEGRGAALRIPFYCEQGHSWYLRFGFHKGNTYTKIERVFDHDFSGNTPPDAL